MTIHQAADSLRARYARHPLLLTVGVDSDEQTILVYARPGFELACRREGPGLWEGWPLTVRLVVGPGGPFGSRIAGPPRA